MTKLESLQMIYDLAKKCRKNAFNRFKANKTNENKNIYLIAKEWEKKCNDKLLTEKINSI